MTNESPCKNSTDTDHNQNGLHDSFPIRQKYSIYLSSVLITLLKASINLHLPPGLPLATPNFVLTEYFVVRYDPYSNIHLFLFKIHRLFYLMGSNCVLRQLKTFYKQGRCQSAKRLIFSKKNWIFLSSNKTTDLSPRNLAIIRICHSNKILSENKSLQNLSHVLYRLYVKDWK
jgi:hypothetical protein